MADALRLALADLRVRLRAPTTPVWACLAVAALAVALAFRPGEGAALATSWFPWVLGGLAFAVAAASASTLPHDRAEGRAAWLATLRPGGVARRLGAALAGASFAVLAGALAAGLVGLLAPAFGVAREVREAHALPLPDLRRFRDPRLGPEARPLTLTPGTLAAGAGERTLDLGLRPILVFAEGGGPETIHVDWTTESGSGSLALPYHGRLRLPLASADRTVRLVLKNEGLDLAVREGWVLGAERSFASSLFWAGLLLGLAAAVLAPFAVAVSRITSAPTAAGAALLLVVISGMRAMLPELSSVPAGGTLHEAARAVVTGAIALAPDFTGLASAAEPSAGRALGPDALGGLVKLLPHAAFFVLLLLVPERAPADEAAS